MATEFSETLCPEIVGVSSQVGTRALPLVTGLGKALLTSRLDKRLEAYIRHAQ